LEEKQSKSLIIKARTRATISSNNQKDAKERGSGQSYLIINY